MARLHCKSLTGSMMHCWILQGPKGRKGERGTNGQDGERVRQLVVIVDSWVFLYATDTL